jgi:hypothetical protein
MNQTISPTAASTETHWPLERVLFAMAGTMSLVSAVLAAIVSPWFLLPTAFVGVNQWMYVMLRGCPASVVLKRFGVAPQCRW